MSPGKWHCANALCTTFYEILTITLAGVTAPVTDAIATVLFFVKISMHEVKTHPDRCFMMNPLALLTLNTSCINTRTM